MSDEYLKFSGTIYIISYDSDNYDYVINLLKRQKTLGFDIETRPSFKKGQVNLPSIIQFATKEFAVLYRIKAKIISTEIIQIFENESILKIGAGVVQDLNNLKRLKSFNPMSFVDIQQLAKSKNIENISLKRLTEQLFKKKLSKRQQLSNWELPILSEAQVLYAATDAYVCLMLYEKLMNHASFNNS